MQNTAKTLSNAYVYVKTKKTRIYACAQAVYWPGAKSHWPMTSYRPNFITNTRSAAPVAATVSTYSAAAQCAIVAATVAAAAAGHKLPGISE